MSQQFRMPKNQLLAALPEEEYKRLVPHLEFVSLPINQTIYEPGGPIDYVYFPHQAMISLVSLMENGSTIEVGLVGKEGMVGIPIILGGSTTITRAFVQVAGHAERIRADLLKDEFHRGGKLQTLLLRYVQAIFTQVSQAAVCNRLHTVEERLARWLLLVSDSVESNEFFLTQEFIAQMLGTRRSGVTVAAGTLQQAGLIRYSRGKITIANRDSLEATACECYGIIKTEFTRLLSRPT